MPKMHLFVHLMSIVVTIGTTIRTTDAYNPYEVLNITRSASIPEIKKSYRLLAKLTSGQKQR
ncbi:unnamed protein product, partial [Medioppia subpectinata]